MNRLLVITTLLFSVASSHAQVINWPSTAKDSKHLAHVALGYEYGFTTQLGYSRRLSLPLPLIIGLEFSSPFGENLVDDFKVRYGGQVVLYEKNGFMANASVYSNFRRYDTEIVKAVGFGSEFALQLGYYKPSWHLALEFGHDKSIITHLKHSDTMRDIYADVVDGWYLDAGGNFNVGLQCSKSIGKSISFTGEIGITDAEGADVNAIIPLYFQFGLIKKIP